MRQEKITLKRNNDTLVGFYMLPQSEGCFPALIICHGAGEYKENYLEMGDYLTEQGIAVLVMDLYGHGESTGPRHVINIQKWVGDIQASVDFLTSQKEIDPSRISAFGLSSGGTAILEAALVDKRLKSLIALDSTVRNVLPFFQTLGFGLATAVGWVYRLFTRRELYLPTNIFFSDVLPASDPEVNRRLEAHEIKNKFDEFFPFPGGAPSFFVNTITRVSKINQPTLVIWGEEDHIDPVETAHMLYSRLTCKKKLAIVDGNGHVGHIDRNRKIVFALTARWILEEN